MTDKSKPWFRLKLKDDVARKMSREEYEASEHHARFCAKIVRENMPDPTDMLVDLMVYGASPMIMAFSDDKVEYKAINPVEFFEGVVKITDNSVTKQINLSTKQVAERFL